MIKSREKKQRGFISAELGIGIFVVSLLSISGFLLAKSLQDDSKIDQFKQDHITIVKNVENFTSNPAIDAADITNANMINAGVVPEHLVSGSTAKNRFGGTINISKVSAGSPASDHVQIDQPELDKEQCIDVAMWAATYADLVKINTTTTDAKDLTMANAITQCGADGQTVSTLHMIN